jgi:hypothetical protein
MFRSSDDHHQGAFLSWLKSHVDMPLHTIQHAKRINVCCRITTHVDSNFKQ